MTQNPARAEGLVVSVEVKRIGDYLRAAIKNLGVLLAAACLEHIDQLQPKHINHRVLGAVIKSYTQLYPGIDPDGLLNKVTVPDGRKETWVSAQVERW